MIQMGGGGEGVGAGTTYTRRGGKTLLKSGQW